MPNQIKIAIVVGTFPVVSQTFIVNQINTLIDAGHHVNLSSYKKGQDHVIHNSVNKHQLLDRVIYAKNMPMMVCIQSFYL